jgi:hypoxanthine-DNA glycosylase
MFFYSHPQNRYWRVLAAVFGEPFPEDIPARRAFLLRNGIAAWDVIRSCRIAGSSDASITDVVPNDLSVILETAHIEAIFTNGAKSTDLYRKYIYPVTGIPSIKVPSTSPANAAFSLERLCKDWGDALAPYLPLLEILETEDRQ